MRASRHPHQLSSCDGKRRLAHACLLLPCLVAALALAASCASAASGNELMEAVRRNNANKAKRLVESSAYIDFQDKDGATPLMVAAEYGRAEIAKMLLDAGANPNSQGAYGTAPSIAIQKGHTAIADMLRAAGRGEVRAEG